MRDLTKYQGCIKKCEDLLKDKPEAASFIIAYGKLIEVVDDLVDEPKNIERVADISSMSMALCSSNYWIKNSHYLRILEQVIHCIYFASVEWEHSSELWKQRDAKAMSHIGYAMLFGILLLETNNVKLVQSIVLEFMEKAHMQHYDDMSEAVLRA